MPRPIYSVLGPLEIDIMQIVWAHSGPITVKEMYATLRQQRKIAYNTVMTVATHLTEKGVLGREQDKEGHGSPYSYTPLMQRRTLIVQRVEQLLASIGADEVEREYVAAEIRRGNQRIGV
jgi:predicted transcriptional regulator